MYFMFIYVSINVKEVSHPSPSLVFQYVFLRDREKLEFVSSLRVLRKPKYAHRCAVPCHLSRIMAEKIERCGTREQVVVTQLRAHH